MNIDKIICVGKNYLDHAKELGDAIPEKPVLFLKPASILKQAQHWGETLNAELIPNEETHYECEIVLRMNSPTTFDAVSIGLDMTLRTRQALLKKNGHPWTTGKVFKDAATLGPWISITQFQDFMETEFNFGLDGQTKQHGALKDAIMHPKEIIEYINGFFPICPGDIIFTGTPAGVGPVHKGSIGKLTWKDYSYQVQWE